MPHEVIHAPSLSCENKTGNHDERLPVFVSTYYSAVSESVVSVFVKKVPSVVPVEFVLSFWFTVVVVFLLTFAVFLLDSDGMTAVSISNKKATIANAIKAITIGVFKIEPLRNRICFSVCG